MLIDRRTIAQTLSLLPALVASPLALGQQGTALRLSTGAAGGTFFDYGAALAKFMTERTGLTIEAVPSSGTIENVRRIEAGQAELGLLAMGPAYEAWTASAAPWIGQPPQRQARAVFPMYETPFHLATIERTGVKALSDLNGRAVGVGPRNGSNEQIFTKLAEGLGLSVRLANGDPAALADAVLRGEIDALFFGAGAPIPAYTKIAEAAPIRFLPLDGAAARVLRAAFPYLGENVIRARSYRGQDADVPTVALWNFLAARADVSETVIEKLAEAVLSDPAATRAIHSTASATHLQFLAANTFMPFHAGALRYFARAGVRLDGLPR